MPLHTATLAHDRAAARALSPVGLEVTADTAARFAQAAHQLPYG